MFGVTPSPTNNLSPLVGSNLTALAPVNQNQRTFTFRGDHRISDKDRVFGRYSHGRWDLLQRRSFSTGGFPITSDGLYNRETYLEQSHTAMASWTHTFGPTLFVENISTRRSSTGNTAITRPAPSRTSPASSARRIRSINPARRTSTTRFTRESA